MSKIKWLLLPVWVACGVVMALMLLPAFPIAALWVWVDDILYGETQEEKLLMNFINIKREYDAL